MNVLGHSMDSYEMLPLSEGCNQLKNNISQEGSRRENDIPLYQPSSLEDYTELIAKYLPYEWDIFSDDSLKNKLEQLDIDEDTHLKERFPQGAHFLLTILPCSERGNLLEDKEINRKAYIRLLHVHEGRVIAGFGFERNFVHLCLPAAVQACSFTVPTYERNDHFATTTDRNRLKSLITASFQKLKTVLEPALNAAREKIAN